MVQGTGVEVTTYSASSDLQVEPRRSLEGKILLLPLACQELNLIFLFNLVVLV